MIFRKLLKLWESTVIWLRHVILALLIGFTAAGGLTAVSAQVPPIDDGTQEMVIQRGGTQVTTRVLKEAPDPDRGLPSRPGSIIVKFRPGVSQVEQGNSHLQAGAAQLEVMGLPGTRRVQVPASNTAQALAAYRARPDIEYAEPDYLSHVSLQPNDTSFGQQWGLTKINAPAAWDVSQSSSNVRVAVLDCGILSASSTWGDANGFPNGHPDIAPKVILESNFTTSTSFDDLCNHGTHVAGTVAAVTNNATGVAGVAPNASIVNVKVCGDTGSCSSSAIVNGILWAAGCETGTCGARRADVINMSFGGAGACSSSRQAAINTAWSQGLVLVAAAGNENTDVPSSPANCANVVSVAATGSTDLRASFSNYGSWVDVAAPGVSILSTVRTGGYSSFSGTSMASPHVAGLAALLWTTPHNTSNTALVQRHPQHEQRQHGHGFGKRQDRRPGGGDLGDRRRARGAVQPERRQPGE